LFLRRWLKQRTPTNLAGLDIEAESIKLLEINSTDSSNRIENFAIQPLPVGAIVKDEIKNPAAVITALKELSKQSSIKTKNIALAIPRSAAIIKTITIDKRLTPGEIESRAWIEANRHFPDLVGDIYLDFSITGASAEDPTQLELVLVACRKELINPYVEVLRQSGFVPKIIDINCYALERSMSLISKRAPALNTWGLLNLNFSLSSFIIIQKNQLLYAHDHSYDGQRLSTQTKKFLTEEKLAEADPRYFDVLKENLSSHLRHTMHFFYSSRPNINIQRIVISGDCATIPGLAKFIQQEVNIETELANPFIEMSFASTVNKEDLQRYTPALMLSCGLALSQAVKKL
jgi:type IV pilus assembly protein PilM